MSSGCQPELFENGARNKSGNVIDHLFENVIAKENKVVLFVGSFISVAPPTSVPAGGKISSAVMDWLFPQELLKEHYKYDEMDHINKLLGETAFEHIFDTFPDVDALRPIFSDYFNASGYFQPNVNHAAIASLLKKKVVQHVITPNYDRGIEIAFEALSPRNPLHSVVTEQDFNEKGIAPPSIFKIHGCVSEPKTLAFALRHEHFEDWKTECLKDILSGALLIFVAYSGVDIDICPQIYLDRSRLKGTMWLYRQDPPDRMSVSAKLLTDKEGFPDPQATYRLGWDLPKFIRHFASHFGEDYAELERRFGPGSAPRAPTPGSPDELVKRIESILEQSDPAGFRSATGFPREEGLHFWRLSLANSLANPRLAQIMAGEYQAFLDKQLADDQLLLTPKMLRMSGHAKYHRGFYASSLADFNEALACLDEIEKTGRQDARILRMERLRVHMEAGAAYKDALENTKGNRDFWKTRCEEAIALSYAICGMSKPHPEAGDFFKTVFGFFRDIEDSLFASYYDQGDFGRVFSALVYHVSMVHEAAIANEPKGIKDHEQKRNSDYTIITRSLLNRTGNWRTGQYLEGRLIANFLGGDVREFPPINDVVANSVLEYRKVDAIFRNPDGYFARIAQKGAQPILDRLEALIKDAELVGAFPAVWKVMYRRLRLKIWQDGYDIYDGINMAGFKGLPEDSIEYISNTMFHVISNMNQMDRDLSLRNDEMTRVLQHCPQICLVGGLLGNIAQQLGTKGQAVEMRSRALQVATRNSGSGYADG